jgi:hypothetical protein
MYAALWRRLPGPLAVRVLTAFALVALVVVVLFAWVFPAVEPYVPWGNVTVR